MHFRQARNTMISQSSISLAPTRTLACPNKRRFKTGAQRWRCVPADGVEDIRSWFTRLLL